MATYLLGHRLLRSVGINITFVSWTISFSLFQNNFIISFQVTAIIKITITATPASAHIGFTSCFSGFLRTTSIKLIKIFPPSKVGIGIRLKIPILIESMAIRDKTAGILIEQLAGIVDSNRSTHLLRPVEADIFQSSQNCVVVFQVSVKPDNSLSTNPGS